MTPRKLGVGMGALACLWVAAASWTVRAQQPGRDASGLGAGRRPLAFERSAHAQLHTVPVGAVTLGPGFWSARLDVNRKVSLPSLLQQLESHGVVDNFRRLSGRKQVPRRGPLYTDSDLYKWMEAAAFVLQRSDDPEVRRLLDQTIDEIAAAQEKDGYLNTYYALERAPQRFTDFQHGHELYCARPSLPGGRRAPSRDR